MTTEQMHDLAFEQRDDGTIRLEQRDYCGESAIIDLHPCQLQHIAECAGLLPAPPMPDGLIADDDGGEMHHLAIETDDDGTINLYQTRVRGMGGSDDLVVLHPTQALWLGARLLRLGRTVKAVSSPVAASIDSSREGCPPSATGCANAPSEPNLFD